MTGLGATSPIEIRIVIEAARDLKEEAQKSQPQAEILVSRAAALRRVAGSILSWIGRKADAGIDSVIKWGVPLAGAWALSNPEKVYAALVAVAETASTWAQILFSGGYPRNSLSRLLENPPDRLRWAGFAVSGPFEPLIGLNWPSYATRDNNSRWAA